MKTSEGKGLLGMLLLAGALLLATHAGTIAQNVACYMDQGGAGWHLGSGCTLTVESSGVLDVASGGALKIAGTTVSGTAAELNMVAGVTAGTTSASKALVVDTNKRLDTLVIADGGLKLGTAGGTAVTATAVELNETILTMSIADLSAEATYYLVMPHAGTVTKIWSVTNGAVATADVTITCNIGATPITGGVVTIATAGSAAGDVDSATPSAANTVTAG